jgi:hypothetical protein
MMASCSFLAFYPESVIKIRKMLNMENMFKEFDDPVENDEEERVVKYNKLNRLDFMSEIGWIDNGGGSKGN